MKQVTPVGDRVFVKVNSPEEKTVGGILLPSSATKKPTQGEVATAGSGKAVKVGAHRPPAPVHAPACLRLTLPPCPGSQVGDSVVYSKYAGTEVQLQGTDYVLLKVGDAARQRRFRKPGGRQQALHPHALPCTHLFVQEDDVIGLLEGDNIAALRPLQDRVLVEVVEAEDKTSGGLLLTEGAKEKPTVGKVGAGRTRRLWGFGDVGLWRGRVGGEGELRQLGARCWRRAPRSARGLQGACSCRAACPLWVHCVLLLLLVLLLQFRQDVRRVVLLLPACRCALWALARRARTARRWPPRSAWAAPCYTRSMLAPSLRAGTAPPTSLSATLTSWQSLLDVDGIHCSTQPCTAL